MLPKPSKKKINPMLTKVIVVSVAIHALAGLVAGFITIASIVIPDEAKFEEPPEVAEETPPQEVKVTLKPTPPNQQQSMNKLSLNPVSNISVSAVSVDLPSMGDSFTVSAGLGGFSGGNLLGSTRGSIGLGVSEVSVFGLKTKAERILFVIDVNRNMVTDKKGGLNSFQVIKDEITDMVANLSSGTLYNVMLVDRRRQMTFRPQLIPSGQEMHQELVRWISPINSKANKPGLEGVSGAREMEISTFSERRIGDSLTFSVNVNNDLTLASQYALEQSVDAIFFITGYHKGFQPIDLRPTQKELDEWEKTTSDKDYQEQLAEHKAEHDSMEQRIQKKLNQINAQRAKKGQPPRVLGLRSGNYASGIYARAKELEIEWDTPHPGFRINKKASDSEVTDYFRDLVDELYIDQGKKKPSVSVVLFLAGDEKTDNANERSLSRYVRFFGGKQRIIRGADEIKSARSAKNTTN